MNKRVELLNKVLHCVACYLDRETQSLHRLSALEDDYGLDSTEMVCIAVDLEKALGLSLKGIAFGSLKTPDNIVEAIIRLHPTLLAAPQRAAALA